MGFYTHSYYIYTTHHIYRSTVKLNQIMSTRCPSNGFLFSSTPLSLSIIIYFLFLLFKYCLASWSSKMRTGVIVTLTLDSFPPRSVRGQVVFTTIWIINIDVLYTYTYEQSCGRWRTRKHPLALIRNLTYTYIQISRYVSFLRSKITV